MATSPAFRSNSRKFDLLVVMRRTTSRPPQAFTTRWKASAPASVRAIGPHFQHRLFLTATPHNGYKLSRSTSLLELLDDQRRAATSSRREAPESGDDDPFTEERSIDAQATFVCLPYLAGSKSCTRRKNARFIKAGRLLCQPRRTPVSWQRVLQPFRESPQEAPFVASSICIHDRVSTSYRCPVRPAKPTRWSKGILVQGHPEADEEYADDREVENAQAEAAEEGHAVHRHRRRSSVDVDRTEGTGVTRFESD